MGLPKRTPHYVEVFLENSIPHIACLREDNLMEGASYGFVWRVYPYNLSVSRAAFQSTIEKLCHWASENGAEARILEVNFPGTFVRCRRGDYVVFLLTDPVARRLEDESLLPSQRVGATKPCAKVTQVV